MHFSQFRNTQFTMRSKWIMSHMLHLLEQQHSQQQKTAYQKMHSQRNTNRKDKDVTYSSVYILCQHSHRFYYLLQLRWWNEQNRKWEDICRATTWTQNMSAHSFGMQFPWKDSFWILQLIQHPTEMMDKQTNFDHLNIHSYICCFFFIVVFFFFTRTNLERKRKQNFISFQFILNVETCVKQ